MNRRCQSRRETEGTRMRTVLASGVFVGSGTLLILCAELWLQAGHRVAAVVTSDLQNRDWAREGRIPVTEAIEDLSDLLEDGRCDYLFSIVNPSVLAPSILRLARRSAINFHDALLPRYAGVNATSWAIINEELLHGITFHEMIETVDAGPILQQRRVSV